MDLLTKILAFLFSILTAVSGIIPATVPSKVLLEQINAQEITVSTECFGFKYDQGRFSLTLDGKTMFLDAVSEYSIDGKTVSSLDYENISLQTEDVNDLRGIGKTVTATLTAEALPAMKQCFTFYEAEKYFLLSTELTATQGEVASNYIAPMVIRNGNIQNADPRWTNFLEVPFDNDVWVEFETKNIYESGLSHEVGAFFTPDNKDGLIIGSVTHDTWKSAIQFKTSLARIDELKAYSGANTKLTRDQSPHGTVRGEKISSAVFFVGFYENWKDGMNEFARTNTTFTPKRKSVTDSNPIGWNSWGSVQTELSYSNAIATSDYIKENFQDVWKDDENVVYVNLDSYWDNMNDDELRSFVKHCEQNGQVPGIYLSPFVSWWDEEGMKNNYVSGTDYTYNDIRLKKADGTYYGNELDGCFALDVTHPATYIHFKNQLDRLMGLGFRYIKLDFLVHGSLEGDHYDKNIQTGIQAYNYAMSKVAEIVGDDVFINLSMAPIFPYNYANGRRLCCDTYYKINETEYMLNALTYGFWQSELYDYIDPDHIVVWGKDGKATENEAYSRLISGIITGGSFLTGDNFVTPAGNADKAHKRYKELLNNESLIDVLKTGKPFEGKIGAECEYAADVFTLENNGETYIAVFNYGLLPKVKTVDLPDKNCTVTNLLTSETKNVKGGKLLVSLEGRDSVIYKIS